MLGVGCYVLGYFQVEKSLQAKRLLNAKTYCLPNMM